MKQVRERGHTHEIYPPVVRVWREPREWWRLEGIVGGAAGRGRFHLREDEGM